MQRARAFSLIEMIVTLVVAVIMVALGVGAYQTLLGGASKVASDVELSTARLDVQRAAYANGSVFPEGVTDFKTQGITYVTTASDGSGTVSVNRVDDTTLVLAQRTSDEDCLVLVSSLVARPTWALDPRAATCSASLAGAHLAEITSLDGDAPTLLDLS